MDFKLKVFLLIALYFFSFTAYNQELSEIEKLNHKDWQSISIKITSFDSIPEVEPLVYLQFLATLDYPKFDTIRIKSEENQMALSMWHKKGLKHEWVDKEDVAQLIKYIRSKQPAKIPLPVISSQLPTKEYQFQSTVGCEAMLLIQLFKDQEFNYPSLCSTCHFCNINNQDELVEEFEAWWKAIN